MSLWSLALFGLGSEAPPWFWWVAIYGGAVAVAATPVILRRTTEPFRHASRAAVIGAGLSILGIAFANAAIYPNPAPDYGQGLGCGAMVMVLPCVLLAPLTGFVARRVTEEMNARRVAGSVPAAKPDAAPTTDSEHSA